MLDISNIEFRRDLNLQHNFKNLEAFYCPSVSGKFGGNNIPYDGQDPYVFYSTITYNWFKRARNKHYTAYECISIKMIRLLDIYYDKLIMDEYNAAMYKEEMIQWYIRINLISERIMPDIINHMKTLV